MASTRRDTALAFINSFEHLDLDANIALRAPNCRHTIGPTSLGYKLDMTNEDFISHFSGIQEIIAKFPVMVREIFADETGKQVTVWAYSRAIFKDEAIDNEEPKVDWTYYGEYIFVLFMTEAGDKIERIIEFVDSDKVVKMRQLMMRAKRNIAAKKQGSA